MSIDKSPYFKRANVLRLIIHKTYRNCLSGASTLYTEPVSEGYPGKLTIKSRAKHAKVSPDTAARDIKDLVEKGVLIPQQGRMRDVSYEIRCNDSILIVPKPAEQKIK